MTELEKALEFNQQIKQAVSIVYNSLNQGQQKQILKDEDAKAVLVRYGIVEAENE